MCAPLKDSECLQGMNVEGETSLPCTQLQEAIRMAKVFENRSGLAMRPMRFLVKFAQNVWYCMHMNV
jgi:hypothetical protein